MKKIIMLVVIITILTLSACSKKSEVNKEDLPISYLTGSFSINVNDLSQIVGDADYVFVAEVADEVETLYKNTVTIETENGTKEVSDPYTKYTIKVINNIKGKLDKDIEFDILKVGGVSQDNNSIVLYEDDTLLQVGNKYIISAYAQPDGSLLVSGPNSSIDLNLTSKNNIISSDSNEDISNIVSSDNYKEFIKAYENEVVTDRERFKSSYEE